MRRFAIGVRAEVKRGANVEQLVDVAFVDDSGVPVAVGFAFETDGLSVGLTLPARATLEQRRFDPPLERGLRAAYLRRLVHVDAGLPRQSNGFQRAWLRQLHLLVVAARALGHGVDLATADAELAYANDPAAYDAVLDALLGAHSALPIAAQAAIDAAD